MTNKQWIAIARDAIARTDSKTVVSLQTEVSAKDKELAFERLNYLEYQIENGKTD